jgi:ABC-type transport system substrate-binding protein
MAEDAMARFQRLRSVAFTRRRLLQGTATAAASALLAACGSSASPIATPGTVATTGAPSSNTGPATVTGSGSTTSGAKPSAAQGGKIVYAQSVAITQADSSRLMLVYPAASELSFLVCNNLVQFDQKLTLQPGLAESWQLSNDQLTWTFKLRKGVAFQDGTPFNAQAVQAYATRVADPKSNSPNQNLWNQYTDIKAIDDTTIAFSTAKPYAPTLHYLAQEAGGIASPAAIAKYGDDYQHHPVGTGPYKVDAFTPGRSVTCSRFDGFWGGKPALDSVEFRSVPEAQTRLSLLETGEVDIIGDISPTDVERVSKGANTTLLRSPGVRPFWIEFNLNLPIFQDVKVRQAMNYAVDKDAIVKNLFAGYATTIDSPVAPTLPGYAKAGSYPYNPDKAKQLLAEAGWTLGQGGILQKNGAPLKFSLLTGDGQFVQDVLVSQAVQANLKAIGCDVSIQKVEASSFFGYLRLPPDQAKYETVFFGFNPSNGDVGYHLNALFHSNRDRLKVPDIWNLMWYKNDQVDSLLDEANVTVDEQKRFDALGKAQKLIWDDAPMIWLYAPDLLAGTRKNVQGAFLWPTVFMSLRGAYKTS